MPQPGVMIVLLGLALWWTFGQMKSLAVRLEQTESELSTERASGEALRRQYTRIQEVLDDVAKKKVKAIAKREDFAQSLTKHSGLSPVRASAFLMLLLSGCATESPPLMPLPVPNSLFQPCEAPEYRVRNYGDYPGYVVELLVAIEQCNERLRGVREILNQ